ncbi:MAG: hypothetical protein HY077_05720 [Elusimicrobia bacterium]|nr:hypothetical protein [Elusimicrobiota bacterium]
MKMLLCLLLCAAPARAQFEGDPGNAGTQKPMDEDQAVALIKDKILSDENVAAGVAMRISRSRLAARLTQQADGEARQAEILAWVQANPDTAAMLAIGLAADERAGTHEFENSALQSGGPRLEFNANSKKGIFGRLRKSGVDSKLMKKQGENLADEEQRELLNTMFSGQGGQSSKIITQQMAGPKTSQGGVVGQGGFDNSYFNRLSGGNLHGYSPQLQALQSSLNMRRAPGAPRLIETGKLDYETLSYPAYGIKYDISKLEQRLRLERDYALAKALGRERDYNSDQLLDPALEAKLKAEAAAKNVKLSERFERRQAALERAAAAVRDFDAAAWPGKDPMKISKAMLSSLGAKQQEASRWITIASLEEELERLAAQEGFMSAELVAAIGRAPVDDGTKAAYKKRGETYDMKLATIKSNDTAALKALNAADWLSKIGGVEGALEANGGLRKDLGRNIQDFVNTPYRLDALNSVKPRWRQLFDDAVKRYLPSINYSKELLRTDKQRALLKDVFVKIAMGDLDAAHTILGSYEPGRPSKR